MFLALYTASAGFPPAPARFRWGVLSRASRAAETPTSRPQSEAETCQDDSNLFILLPRIGVSRFCGVLLDINIQYQKTTITHITEGVLCC